MLTTSKAVLWQDILGTTPADRWGLDAAALAKLSPEMLRLVGRMAQLPPFQVMEGAQQLMEAGRPDMADIFLGLAEQDLARMRLHMQLTGAKKGTRG